MWPLLLIWDTGFSNMIFQLILGIIGLELVFRIWRRRIHYLKVHDFRKGHTWCSIDEFDDVIILLLNCFSDGCIDIFFSFSHQPSHCSICEEILLAGGMLCDSCGICVDSGCMKKANKRILCKPVSLESTSMKHHWVKGCWTNHFTYFLF